MRNNFQGRIVFSLVMVLSLALAAAATTQPAAAANAGRGPQYVKNQYIVIFKDSVVDSGQAAQAKARQHGLGRRHTFSATFKGFSAFVPDGRLAALRADPDVAFVTQDQYVTLAAQTLPTGINRIDADVNSQRAGNGAGAVTDSPAGQFKVAVIDTGIDTGHQDLNVVGGYNCATPDAADPAPRNPEDWNDYDGHGTHVAGIIGAKDNNLGVVGVAPGANLLAVRVFNASGGTTGDDILCGLEWVAQNAAAHNIRVANMSITGGGFDAPNCGRDSGDAWHMAVCRINEAGVSLTVAAGNSNENIIDGGSNPSYPYDVIPAAYDEAITVAAMADSDGRSSTKRTIFCGNERDDWRASFSNYGVDVDLTAPGVCIYSTYRGNSYATMSGTSMAAPHVAGAAVLYLMKNPDATPAQVRSGLRAAGTTNYNNSSDPDGIKEPLLYAGKL